MPPPSPSLALCALALGTTILACASPAPLAMTQEQMETRVRELASDVEGQPGAIQFRYADVAMACVSDPPHDRMRLVAPIIAVDDVPAELLEILLAANYHTALDARYAISDGRVFAAYLHPLGSLTDAQLESALRQVASLVQTFGGSFSSGELSFGTPQTREAPGDPEEREL